jgi:hypothetical protein
MCTAHYAGGTHLRVLYLIGPNYLMVSLTLIFGAIVYKIPEN